jgi:hypothetical protein
MQLVGRAGLGNPLRVRDTARVTESWSPSTGPIYNLFCNFVYLCKNSQRHLTFQKLGPCNHYLSLNKMRLHAFNSSSQKVDIVIDGSSLTLLPGWGCWPSCFPLGLDTIRTTHNSGILNHREKDRGMGGAPVLTQCLQPRAPSTSKNGHASLEVIHTMGGWSPACTLLGLS